MREQRLIDANALKEDIKDMKADCGNHTYVAQTLIDEFFPCVIDEQPTIDPETLPIVSELRDRNRRLKAVVKVQLESLRIKTFEIDELSEKIADLYNQLIKVTAERDLAITQLRLESYNECMYCANKKKKCDDCNDGINWEWKGIENEK